MDDSGAVDYQPLEAEQHVFKLVLKRFKFYSAVVLLVATALMFLVPLIGFSLLLVWVVALTAAAGNLKNGLWEEFAAANGWPVNAVGDASTVIPLSLQFGHSQSVSPAITASLNGVIVDMLVYTTVTGEGKYQVRHSFTVARVELPAVLPHILLRAKKDRAMLQQDFADHESLQLEGDFDDYFSLQIESGQEVNALEILTPDVMQALVSYSQREDVEIGGSNLYFIIVGDDRGADSVRQLVQSVSGLSTRIVGHITETTASTAGAPTASTLTAT